MSARASKSSANAKTHVSHACTISESIKRTMIRLLAEVLSRKNPFFHSMQTEWCCTDSGPAEPKIIYSTSPGPALPTDATSRTCSVLGGPSPRRGNASGFRRTFEAQGLGAHFARKVRTAAPRPRSNPPTSTRSFVSRRHKSRRDPRSRTGLQYGQFIVGEASQRPVVKVYILYIYMYTR